MPQARERVNRYGVNTISKHIGQGVMTGALLFLGAGTLGWPWGWVFTGVTLAGWAGLSVALAVGNPALLNQRGRRVKDAAAGTPRWDIAILAVYAILMLVQPFVAGLDRRWAVSAEVTPTLALAGNALLLAGFFLLAWSMVANRSFEPTVRLEGAQKEGVTASGPYRYLRHPGYTGVILQFLAMPIALGTWLALIPGALGIGLFILRTALEDRMLQVALPGYAEFAQRTRYRLFPGVW